MIFFLMFTDYLHYLMSKAEYLKDEDGGFIAKIPWYQGFYSQGDTLDEARENLEDAVEGVLFIKLQQKDPMILEDMQQFISQGQLEYA